MFRFINVVWYKQMPPKFVLLILYSAGASIKTHTLSSKSFGTDLKLSTRFCFGLGLLVLRIQNNLS